MRRPGADGGFVLCFLFNLLLNAGWAAPAAALFVAHFALGSPIWPAWAALGLWVAAVLAVTAFLSWASSTSGSGGAGTGRRGKTTVRRSSDRR